MNILAIMPQKLQNTANAQQSQAKHNTGFAIPPYGLQKDTVSFSGVNKLAQQATNTISDVIEAKVEREKIRMTRIATTYLDALEAIALSLRDDGISFDRAYCELNPVKSAKSYTSKIVRSGSFKVPDAIRATLYVKNPYDLSLLNDKLLPEMQKRGYILAHTDIKHEELLKRGYLTPPGGNLATAKAYELPDLDIRLEDARDNISQLAPELQYSISKPQKSGYEDIQMRFVREFDKKKNPIQHELIILFGPNYAQAKHIESEKVYNHLRNFGELHMKFEDQTLGSHSQKATRYIDLIREMFVGKVSKKLFLNAKNKDLYDIQDEIPIRFTDDDINLFNTYFSGLKDRVRSCYSEHRKAAAPSALAQRELAASQRHDRALITQIHDGLADTIEYFNHLTGIKDAKTHKTPKDVKDSISKK